RCGDIESTIRLARCCRRFDRTLAGACWFGRRTQRQTAGDPSVIRRREDDEGNCHDHKSLHANRRMAQVPDDEVVQHPAERRIGSVCRPHEARKLITKNASFSYMLSLECGVTIAAL